MWHNAQMLNKFVLNMLITYGNRTCTYSTRLTPSLRKFILTSRFTPIVAIVEKIQPMIPGCETSSLLDRNLAMACRPSVSKKRRKKKEKNIQPTFHHPNHANVEIRTKSITITTWVYIWYGRSMECITNSTFTAME